MGKNTIGFAAHPDGVVTTAAVAAPGKYAIRSNMKFQDTSKPIRDQEPIVETTEDKTMIQIPLEALSTAYPNFQQTASRAKSGVKIMCTRGAGKGTITTREDVITFARDEVESILKV